MCILFWVHSAPNMPCKQSYRQNNIAKARAARHANFSKHSDTCPKNDSREPDGDIETSHHTDADPCSVGWKHIPQVWAPHKLNNKSRNSVWQLISNTGVFWLCTTDTTAGSNFYICFLTFLINRNHFKFSYTPVHWRNNTPVSSGSLQSPLYPYPPNWGPDENISRLNFKIKKIPQ